VARCEAEEDFGEEVVTVQRQNLQGGGGEGAALGGGDQALLLGHLACRHRLVGVLFDLTQARLHIDLGLGWIGVAWCWAH